jgi:calcineurin-like phosphoesterase family protein
MKSNIFFTSDLHFGHKNILTYCPRPYKTVEEMNETLVNNWNSVVSSIDTVYVLGDLMMSYEQGKNYVKRLQGKKYLIFGNHDKPFGKTGDTYKKWEEAYKDLGFNEIYPKLTYEGFNLNHIPYECPFDKREYLNKYKTLDDGTPLLCGHVHEKWGTLKTSKGTIQINVGVDSPGMPWSGLYRPATFEEIYSVYEQELDL